MMISMRVANEDSLNVPQHFPNVIWLVRIRAKESTHLAPRPFAGFKQYTPMIRDPDKVP